MPIQTSPFSSRPSPNTQSCKVNEQVLTVICVSVPLQAALPCTGRRRIYPARQNVRNARPSFIATDEREDRTLRVLPLDDPATPGYLHRTIDDLSAAGFDALDGCVDGLDVEVKVPTRHRNLRRLGHHAAVAHLFVVALVEDAINA